MELKFILNGQELNYSKKNILANNSQDFLIAKFDFSEEWDNTEKTAIFYNTEDKIYNVLLKDNSCIIPHEVLQENNLFYVGVFGINGTERITSTIINIRLENGAYKIGETPSEPSEDVYAQIISLMQESKEIAKSAEEKAQSVVNRADLGEFCGPAGPQGPIGPVGPQGEQGIQGEKGDSYEITEQDYNMIEEQVKQDIQSTLNANLKESKDYTDNANARDFKEISYNQDTATFVFTRHDNTTFTVDLPVEQTVKNGYYDEQAKELVLVLVSEQEIRIPASGLIDDYIGLDSATIQLTISADNKITANIKSGTINKTLLTTELQEELNNKLEESDLTNYIKDTNYVDGAKAGVIKAANMYGLYVSNQTGYAYLVKATTDEIDKRTNTYKPIVPSNLDYAVKSVAGGHVTLTQAEYDALVEAGNVETNTYYYIVENEV